MAGRVQKCAAATVAAWVSAGSAWAFESPALVPALRIVPGEVRWTGDDARGRWSLVAGAQRADWDSIEPDATLRLPVPAAEARGAIAAESVSGRVAFDAQRAFLEQRLDAAFFATRAALALREDGSAVASSLDERSLSRVQRTRFGFSASLSGRGRMLGLPWDRTVAFSLGGDHLDSRTTMGNAWGGPASDLRRDLSAETSVGLDARQAWRVAPGLTLASGARLERYRTRAGGLETPAVAKEATEFSPFVEAAWTPTSALAFFASARRGAGDGSRSRLALDPWTTKAPGLIDPESVRATAETGIRLRGGSWETRLLAWRTRAPAELAFGDAGPIETLQPGARRGIGMDFRYRPMAWLEARADLRLDASRSAEGPALPGAPRVFGSAGATFRMSRDWDAKLVVSYLGPRDNVDEGEALPGSTLANFQVVRWFGRTTRISFDVFNVFNQRPRVVDSFAAARSGMLDGTGETFLSSPAEPRGFLLKLRTRF